MREEEEFPDTRVNKIKSISHSLRENKNCPRVPQGTGGGSVFYHEFPIYLTVTSFNGKHLFYCGGIIEIFA